MRAAVMSMVLVLQTGIVVLAGVLDATADGSTSGKPTVVPIDRTRLLLALPERPPQAQPRPRASASPAAASQAFPILAPAPGAR